MFRGRRPRKLRRPMARGRALRRLPPRARDALARANRMMAAGDFAAAAAAFGRTADRAQARGMPVRAAHLALQASRAHFAGAQVAAAVQWAKAGLLALIAAGRAGQAVRLMPRIAATLRGEGYHAEASDVETEIGRALGDAGLSIADLNERLPSITDRRGTLPARCPGCAASLVPDEVE